MSEPGTEAPRPSTGEQLIDERRRRGARGVALVALIACALSTPFCIGIAIVLDRRLGLALLGIIALLGTYEAVVLALLRRGRHPPVLDWLGAAVEVSVPTLIAVVDADRIGPAYALTSAPVMLYALAVLASALRLRPKLVLFAGALGCVEMVLLYAGLRGGLDPELVARLPSLGASNVIQRAAYVLLAGVVGWFLCRSLLRLARDLSAQLLAREESERRREELSDQLHQAQKMEAIGQLAGGIAHDFNNLLTTILGHAELLEEDLEEPDQLGDVEQIQAAGKRAAELTGQLLSFSRKQTFQLQSVDLSRVVEGSSRMLERLVGESIALRFTPSDGPLSVLVDPNRLEQVLVNLVLNARDASPDGGEIEIRTARLPAPPGESHVEDRSWAALIVRDHGVGMDEATRARVFEPFFTTKPRDKGTGLGLATAYGIVKQCAGQITVASTPGEGSTFQVLLPTSAEPPRTPRSDVQAIAEGGTETVLVAEDEDALRDYVGRVLERAGYRVLSAEDAPTALAKAAAHDGPIHLLLTDVIMPGPTGKELWDDLVRERPDARVLFMSGYAEDVLGEQGSLGPETPLLAKPFTAQELKARVRGVLGG